MVTSRVVPKTRNFPPNSVLPFSMQSLPEILAKKGGSEEIPDFLPSWFWVLEEVGGMTLGSSYETKCADNGSDLWLVPYSVARVFYMGEYLVPRSSPNRNKNKK